MMIAGINEKSNIQQAKETFVAIKDVTDYEQFASWKVFWIYDLFVLLLSLKLRYFGRSDAV